MDNISFTERVELYLVELSHWKVWQSIFLGQVLSLLLSGKCILSTMLQGAIYQFPTTSQLVLPYVALFLLFMPVTICKGKNQLVGDMLCLAGSLLFAVATVLQEFILKKQSCTQYLAMLGFYGTVLSCTQSIVLELTELVRFHWEYQETLVQLGYFCGIQTLFQILMSVVLRDGGSVLLHLSFLSADYYTLIAGIYIYQFKFHGLYFVSYTLALVGVMLYAARQRAVSSSAGTASPAHHPLPSAPHLQADDLPQLINDSMRPNDDVSMEFTVPTLDCIPIDGLEPPMSRDTTFTSFLGGPHTNGHYITKDPC